MACTFKRADIRIVADDDIQISVLADFFKETHVAGVEPVVTAGDENFSPAGENIRILVGSNWKALQRVPT